LPTTCTGRNECNATFLQAMDQLIKGATAEGFDAFQSTIDQVGHA
jgi:hypothetical protein